MANTTIAFSIQQEKWQHVWVAATAAVKSRKKQQVEFNIQHRIDELLQEFGPQSDMPLTLRVYGTMMKGFTVLNNERARLLYTDCERVVFMFGQQPVDDGTSAKAPTAKRQRTDALAMDLELAKVQESEMYNWIQPPSDAAALLHPDSSAGATLPDAQALPQPSLLDDVRLLDEAFPPIDMQAVVQLDAAAEAVQMAEAAEAAAAAELVAEAPFPPLEGVGQVQNVAGTLERPTPLIAELLATVGNPNNLTQMALLLEAAEVHRRGPRLPQELPGAGHVFGFDLHTILPSDECDEWQISHQDIGGRAREPAEFSEVLVSETSEPDRLGLLHAILDPMSEAASIQRMLSLNMPPLPDQEGSMPEVQALLAGDQEQQDLSSANAAQFLGGLAEMLESSLGVVDPFRPYVPEVPLSSTQGADRELAGALQDNAVQDALPDDEQAEDEVRYDEQTAQVAGILHRYIESSAGASRKMTLDDLIPPSTTDKAVAARTFLAVLTLATAGDFKAEQMQPYGPITISEP